MTSNGVTEPILAATGIQKEFGGIHALRGADLDVRRGEVHALMGENGAGKSTLAKIIAGVERADKGHITWLGQPVSFQSTAEAARAGLTIVLQELSLVPDLSVAENIFLTNPSVYRGGIWLDRGQIRRRTRELFERFDLKLAIDPDTKIRELSIAQQQLIEIIRAFSQNSQLYLLDEPTAALGDQEVDVLFGIIRSMCERGVSFVLVTHRLNEVFALSDRITVLRDGANSGAFVTADATPNELIRSMVGRDLGDFFAVRNRVEPGNPVLTVDDLCRGHAISHCTFEVRRGEVVGIAGLIGSGRTELVRSVFGADRATSGEVQLNGTAGLVRSPKQGVDRGAAMVPEDRKQQGLHIDLSIADNITLSEVNQRGGFWLRGAREQRTVRSMVERLQIKARDTAKAAGSLSGGNQQKIVLAKWLATEPDLLILDEPTRGIDVGTKMEIYNIVDQLAAAGSAVLIVSSELPEILALSDRVLVMSEGEIVAELDRAEATEERIMAYAARRHDDVIVAASEESE
jgi:ABC-type sugar transport system ATPase subunit